MRIRLNLTRDPVEEKPHSWSCGKLWKKNLTPVEEKPYSWSCGSSRKLD